jgi:replicative superfamily II helicase
MRCPTNPPGYEYLRGPQEQVLDSWFTRRAIHDLVIKMNTGGGKTIVGLLVAASSLNEGSGPLAYLVPDHYLAEQVRDEARMLGIAVTDDARSAVYMRGKAILVDVFARLFNWQSIFGVAGTVSKPPSVSIGTLIVDDAHACLAKAEESFRLKVPADDPVYRQILELFRSDISEQSPAGMMDLEASRYSAVQHPGHGMTSSPESWSACTR